MKKYNSLWLGLVSLLIVSCDKDGLEFKEEKQIESDKTKAIGLMARIAATGATVRYGTQFTLANYWPTSLQSNGSDFLLNKAFFQSVNLSYEDIRINVSRAYAFSNQGSYPYGDNPTMRFGDADDEVFGPYTTLNEFKYGTLRNVMGSIDGNGTRPKPTSSNNLLTPGAWTELTDFQETYFNLDNNNITYGGGSKAQNVNIISGSFITNCPSSGSPLNPPYRNLATADNGNVNVPLCGNITKNGFGKRSATITFPFPTVSVSPNNKIVYKYQFRQVVVSTNYTFNFLAWNNMVLVVQAPLPFKYGYLNAALLATQLNTQNLKTTVTINEIVNREFRVIAEISHI